MAAAVESPGRAGPSCGPIVCGPGPAGPSCVVPAGNGPSTRGPAAPRATVAACFAISSLACFVATASCCWPVTIAASSFLKASMSPPLFAHASRVCSIVATSLPCSTTAALAAEASDFSAVAPALAAAATSCVAFAAAWPIAVVSFRTSCAPDRSARVSKRRAMRSVLEVPIYSRPSSAARSRSSISLRLCCTAASVERMATMKSR
jgi:hypothetical protein